MVHSLVEHPYPPEFFDWPGLIIFDEVHRVAAQTWSRVPPKFSSRWRIGLSATPRRKDGAENVFRYHIGPVMFAGKERRLAPAIRRVYTTFRVVRTPMFNPSLMKHNLLLRFMCANETRNKQIIQQLVLAVLSGRKVLILSERLNHLKRLQDLLIKSWPSDKGPVPSIGYHVGGMSEDDLYAATECRVILATVQYVTEALDIPALDTLFLVTPLADVEQAVGRILRPFEGKKNPVVVDFIDSQVQQCVSMAEKRDRQYTKMVRQ
jgi:superfamily II DNA or RNA helicase